jgi:pimeloyl-ACP methyl ester carboxylesterase
MMEVVTYPGAVAPNRTRRVDSGAISLAVYEWGPVDGQPLFLVHGGFDFARTFDVFAPLLAERGWRVISWDQRGHGDSDHAELYSWDADIRDAISVIEAFTDQPAPVVAHSKGGAVITQLADAQPFRFSHLVNIDGIPYRRAVPDVSDHDRTRLMATEIEGWLDRRRRVATAERRPGTLDDLARRRGRMNPRLSHEWLRYLVSVGARLDDDGWRWKIDPAMRPGGFGPWRPEWSVTRLPGLNMQFLGFLAGVHEEMGWGTKFEDVRPFLPYGGQLRLLDGVGHFCHIEQPQMIADAVIEMIGDGK